MPGILVTLLGVLAYYSKSKYFPAGYSFNSKWLSKGLGVLFFVLGTGFYISEWGPVVGTLVAVTVIPAAYCLLMLLLAIPKNYAAAFSLVLLFFLAIELFC